MEKLYSSKALLKKVPQLWIRPDPLSNSWNKDCSNAQTTTGDCGCGAAAL